MNAQDTSEYLKELGLTEDEAVLYLALMRTGSTSILEASRITKIERTKLYRLAELMEKKGLIYQELAFKTTMLKATPVANLRLMVQDRINRAEELKNNFEEMVAKMGELANMNEVSKIYYFNGPEGVKQMQWNTLQTKGEMTSYVARAFQESVGQKFLDDYAKRWRELNVDYREIKSVGFEATIDPKKKLRPVDLGPKYRWKIDKKGMIEVVHNMDIYNEVVAMYYWDGNEVMGVEIHNRWMAKMQKGLFELAWKAIS